MVYVKNIGELSLADVEGLMIPENKLYEGKTKIVYRIPEESKFMDTENDLCVIEYKDALSKGDGKKIINIEGFGMLRAHISSKFMNAVQKAGVSTAHLGVIKDSDVYLEKVVNMAPLEIVSRFKATGSLVRTFPTLFEEGQKLENPTTEFYHKDDERHDPKIHESVIITAGLATEEEIGIMKEMPIKVGRVVDNIVRTFGPSLELVDIKIEVGRTKNGELVLADEISPDTMRLWDENGKGYDKDRFRKELGGITAGYQIIHDNVCDCGKKAAEE